MKNRKLNLIFALLYFSISLSLFFTGHVRVAFFFSLFSVFSYFLYYNFFWKKVSALSKNLKKIENGFFEKSFLFYDEIKFDKRNEIGELLDTFDKMKEALLERELELNEKNRFLEEKNRKLLEYDQLKNHFLANISHELKTPLNAIIGFTELMLDEVLGPLNEKQKEKMERVLKRSQELLDLINQILEINKIIAGKSKIEKESILLKSFFNELYLFFEPILERKKIELKLPDFNGSEKVYADYKGLKMVFSNLISNAIKFTDKGFIEIIYEDYDKDGILFSIKDTGIGIPRDEWENIFNTFYQVDSSSTRKYGGSGLGLAIVKEIVSMHGGKIWVESKVGEGTTFYFTISKVMKEVVL